MHITTRESGIELYFPPLRSAGSALMLALFGATCCVLGGAATSGLLNSENAGTVNLLAFAFAGVFALPLMALGFWFVIVAFWTAANSLTVDVSAAGVRTDRRFLGYLLARRELRRSDIEVLEVRPAAKYLGVFGTDRYFCVFARSRNCALLVADSLKGVDSADGAQRLVAQTLGMPGLATVNIAFAAPIGPEQ